jgi:hypothetical protein
VKKEVPKKNKVNITHIWGLVWFCFTKVKTRKAEQVLSGWLVPLGVGRIYGKGVGRRIMEGVNSTTI